MCGSARHRDTETTRNKFRTNKSHLQIVGQNRMNGSVRDSSVLFQLHDGHSSIILNQLSHFFNRRNSGNFLAALRIPLLCTPDDGHRNCPKHVEFYSKNKFEKLVHLFGFIRRYWTHNAYEVRSGDERGKLKFLLFMPPKPIIKWRYCFTQC